MKLNFIVSTKTFIFSYLFHFYWLIDSWLMTHDSWLIDSLTHVTDYYFRLISKTLEKPVSTLSTSLFFLLVLRGQGEIKIQEFACPWQAVLRFMSLQQLWQSPSQPLRLESRDSGSHVQTLLFINIYAISWLMLLANQTTCN